MSPFLWDITLDSTSSMKAHEQLEVEDSALLFLLHFPIVLVPETAE